MPCIPLHGRMALRYISKCRRSYARPFHISIYWILNTTHYTDKETGIWGDCILSQDQKFSKWRCLVSESCLFLWLVFHSMHDAASWIISLTWLAASSEWLLGQFSGSTVSRLNVDGQQDCMAMPGDNNCHLLQQALFWSPLEIISNLYSNPQKW